MTSSREATETTCAREDYFTCHPNCLTQRREKLCLGFLRIVMEGRKSLYKSKLEISVNFILRVTSSLKTFHFEVDKDATNNKTYFMISDNPAEKEDSITPHIKTVSSDYIFNSVLQCEFS